MAGRIHNNLIFQGDVLDTLLRVPAVRRGVCTSVRVANLLGLH